MCDYPITPITPLLDTPLRKDPYELYAKSNGNTIEQQKEADTFVCGDGTRVVRYLEFVRWLHKMQKSYILYQAVYHNRVDLFWGIDAYRRFDKWLEDVIVFNQSQRDAINRQKELETK